MQIRNVIKGASQEELFLNLQKDMATQGLHDYHVAVEVHGHHIELDIVRSPGGGYEGGYGYTFIKVPVASYKGFVFAIHPEDIFNKLGKLFGLEDVTTGYKEFDENVIVKTNNKDKFIQIFESDEVRNVFENLSGYTFKLEHEEDEQGSNLELDIQRGITDINELQLIFNAFHKVLDGVM